MCSLVLSTSLFPVSIPSQGKGSSQWLCCGRLVCDVKVSAKELIRVRSYDLSGEQMLLSDHACLLTTPHFTELASSVLNVQYLALAQEDVLAAFRYMECVEKNY